MAGDGSNSVFAEEERMILVQCHFSRLFFPLVSSLFCQLLELLGFAKEKYTFGKVYDENLNIVKRCGSY